MLCAVSLPSVGLCFGLPCHMVHVVYATCQLVHIAGSPYVERTKGYSNSMYQLTHRYMCVGRREGDTERDREGKTERVRGREGVRQTERRREKEGDRETEGETGRE